MQENTLLDAQIAALTARLNGLAAQVNVIFDDGIVDGTERQFLVAWNGQLYLNGYLVKDYSVETSWPSNVTNLFLKVVLTDDDGKWKATPSFADKVPDAGSEKENEYYYKVASESGVLSDDVQGGIYMYVELPPRKDPDDLSKALVFEAEEKKLKWLEILPHNVDGNIEYTDYTDEERASNRLAVKVLSRKIDATSELKDVYKNEWVTIQGVPPAVNDIAGPLIGGDTVYDFYEGVSDAIKTVVDASFAGGTITLKTEIAQFSAGCLLSDTRVGTGEPIAKGTDITLNIPYSTVEQTIQLANESFNIDYLDCGGIKISQSGYELKIKDGLITEINYIEYLYEEEYKHDFSLCGGGDGLPDGGSTYQVLQRDTSGNAVWDYVRAVEIY